MRMWKVASGAVLGICFLCSSCGDPDNFLDGSLGSQYDLGFDRVRIREYTTSRELAIEYIRGSAGAESQPIIYTLPIPEGTGSFDREDGVRVNSNPPPGGAQLPDATDVHIHLNAYSPGQDGSNVQGSLGGSFTHEGTGATFALEGAFKGPLEVVAL